jgi:hypothetical protein
MKKLFLIISMLPVISCAQTLHSYMSQDESIYYYQTHFPLKDPYKKLVDDKGNGFEPLYGVRNFRAVLNGVVYRGGANNIFNKYGERSNSNPLPNLGLRHLCEQGFGTAVYLYDTNYSSAPKTTQCQSVNEPQNVLTYKQESVLLSVASYQRVLNLIYKKLTVDTDQSPIYLHCWNGWHASGFISALTLRQFCGYTGDQAVNYWNLNTDGNNKGSGYDRIRARIRAYQPDPSMMISSALKAKVCPVAN